MLGLPLIWRQAPEALEFTFDNLSLSVSLARTGH